MNEKEWTLDLQAYVDGELEPSRRADVERVLAGDAEARELAAALRSLGELVRAHEPLARVPETREFYWSQIQRRIAAAEAAEGREARPATGALNWLRWLAPALGVAAVAVFVVLPRDGRENPTLASNGPVEDAVSMTFRSDADGVTIHWIN